MNKIKWNKTSKILSAHNSEVIFFSNRDFHFGLYCRESIFDEGHFYKNGCKKITAYEKKEVTYWISITDLLETLPNGITERFKRIFSEKNE